MIPIFRTINLVLFGKSLRARVLIACIALAGGAPMMAVAEKERETRAGATLPLEDMILGEGAWERSPEDFQKEFGAHGLEWLSADKDRARFFGSRLSMWDGAVRPVEIIVMFQNQKQAGVEVSIFTRADSRTRYNDQKSFQDFVEGQKVVIERAFGVRAEPKRQDPGGVVRTQGWQLRAPTAMADLEFSMQRERRARGESFQAEFLRLRATPFRSMPEMGRSQAGRADDRRTLAQRVRRDKDGTVWIPDVPMVDQGPKGYCAVATTERMLRYYGIDVDQHEIAQIAGADAGFGTDPDVMMSELRRKQGRLRVRIRSHYDMDVRAYEKMTRDYNRMAERANARRIPEQGNLIIVSRIYASVDPEVFKDYRVNRTAAEFTRFQQTVVQSIDRGVPLLWGVYLGIFPEQGLPQSGGGHMRLIIGYNTKTREIVFSDSWGADHAVKKMPLENAWTITSSLGAIEP